MKLIENRKVEAIVHASSGIYITKEVSKHAVYQEAMELFEALNQKLMQEFGLTAAELLVLK